MVTLKELIRFLSNFQEFYIPMKTAGLLTPEQLQTIFCNIDELRSVNAKFADQLRDTMQLAMEQGDEVSRLKISQLDSTQQNFIVTYRWVTVQERHNSSALAMELLLSCTNPSIWNTLKW